MPRAALPPLLPARQRGHRNVASLCFPARPRRLFSGGRGASGGRFCLLAVRLLCRTSQARKQGRGCNSLLQGRRLLARRSTSCFTRRVIVLKVDNGAPEREIEVRKSRTCECRSRARIRDLELPSERWQPPERPLRRLAER